MPQITVRPFEERDSDGFFHVRSLTYNNGEEIPVDKRVMTSKGYVAELDGRIAGVFSVLDMTATRGEALLSCGALALVAVDPVMRRGGIGTEMMRGAVRLLREEGVPLSSLYAYREPFYRKCGYEVAGKRIEIQCPTHRLPSVQGELPVRHLTPADWRLIAPCHATFAHQRSGVNVRSEQMWKRFLDENRPNTIYAVGDPMEGYVALYPQVNFWVDQRLTEVAWSTPRGYRACLELLRQVGINKTSVTWFEPSDSPFLAQYLDQGVEVRVARPAMFRVHDVPASLSALKPTCSGEFCIAVRDDVIPENDGPWTVRYSYGSVEVSLGGQPDLSIDIRQFAQAFLGEPDLVSLARIGLVDVVSVAGFADAARLLPASPTCCSDFF